jgi:hypothetical protein
MITIPPPADQRHKPDRQQVQQAAASAGLILPDAALLALQEGRVIEAIKIVRGANPGLDLARAKAAMQRMQAQAHAAVDDKVSGPFAGGKPSLPVPSRRPPTVEMGDPPGQLRWLLVLAGLLAAVAWFGFGGGS